MRAIYLLFLASFPLIANTQSLNPSFSKIPVYELGNAIFLLMPDRGIKQYFWDHRANSDVYWLHDGYNTENWQNGEVAYSRQGLLRINVRGHFSTVLRKRKMELPWTVRFESMDNPKFGIEKIILSPGFPDEPCFGSLFDKCEFEVAPSLRRAKITTRQFCKLEDVNYMNIGYSITHPLRSPALLIHKTGWGSGGSESSIEIRLGSESTSLCDP